MERECRNSLGYMGAWQIAVGTQQDNNFATTVCRSCGGNTSPRIPPLHSIASPYDIRQLLTATSFKFVESLEIRVTRHGLPATLHLISSSGSHSERANIRRFSSAHVVPGFITGRAPAHLSAVPDWRLYLHYTSLDPVLSVEPGSVTCRRGQLRGIHHCCTADALVSLSLSLSIFYCDSVLSLFQVHGFDYLSSVSWLHACSVGTIALFIK